MKINCNKYEIDGTVLWKVGNDEIGHNYYDSATQALEITKYLQAQADYGRVPDLDMVFRYPYYHKQCRQQVSRKNSLAVSLPVGHDW